MSTTIKRIALVAVAALGLGVMSVAPSQATNTILQFNTGDADGPTNATGFGVAGAFNFVTVDVVGGAADYVLTTDSTFIGQGNASPLGVLSPDAKSLSMTDTDVAAIRVATPVAGTVTVRYWVRTNGQLAATAAQTVTITVNATKQSGAFSAANSTAVMASGETTTMPLTDATVNAVSTINLDTAVATVKVTLQDALKAAYDDTVTATVVSGSANVKVLLDSESTTVGVDTPTSKAAAGTASSSVKTGASGIAYVLIYSSGIAGPATVRISLSDGTVIANENVTFSSTTVASITPTVVYSRVTGDAGAPTNGTVGTTAASRAITVLLKDQAGFAIAGAAGPTATTDVATFISGVSCGTATAAGVSTCAVTPIAGKYGTTVITFTSGTVKATASITTAAAKASTITVTAPSSVEAGSQAEFTFTAKDSTGAAIADGAYAPGAFIASVTSSSGSSAFTATDTITVTAGVATAKVFAPYITGTWKTTWVAKGTAATASAVAVGTDNVAAAIAGASIVTDIAISNAAADAALDAANEAATAAQDATDAAIQAADAADEATAAVAALQLEVNTLIAGLKKQLTTLTNLVKNLAKAVAKK